MFRMIAIDLDGTLINSHGRISDANKNVIGMAIDSDVKVVICSGRIFSGAKIFGRELGIREPLITCNGAIIKHMDTKEVLYKSLLSAEGCLKVIKLCRSEDIYFHVYIEDFMFTERLAFASLSYWERNKELPESDRVDIRLVKSIEDVIINSSTPPTKLVAVSRDSTQLKRLRKKVEEVDSVQVMSSRYDNFEVVNQGVGKGNALKYLSEQYGIKREEIIAVGDNENDDSMLRFAGMGVAMGNAEKSIKEIADYVTDTNDDDGVAKVIKKFVL